MTPNLARSPRLAAALARAAGLLLLAIIAAPAGAQEPRWIAPLPPVTEGPAPDWIWAATTPPPTTRDAPEGTVWLAREFDVPPHASLQLAIAADNRAAVFLNGDRVLTATSRAAPAHVQLVPREGRNLLVIKAVNAEHDGDNPAGVVARLAITATGATHWLVTDCSWVARPTAWAGCPAAPPPAGTPGAVAVGPVQSPPWSLSAAAFSPPRPCPMVRRSFTLEEPPTRATVRIVGLGHYELRCNGSVVGDTLINQAWSQYDKTIYQQEFDLAPHLRAGENVLAVTLGNSFWQVGMPNDGGRFCKTDAMPDFAAGWPHLLWLDATIATASGTLRVVSDEAWRWAPSPLTFSHIYAGEDFDARLAQPGWDAPRFDDAAWEPVVPAPAPRAALAPLPAPGMKAFESFAPVEVKQPAPGIFTHVFPQNCSALLRFTLTGGKAGDRVRFRPCEYIDDTGRVKFTYTWGTGKDIWHDYTKAGPDAESHRILFCYVGAQFVQVEGAVSEGMPNPDHLPVLTELELVHVRAACPAVGEIHTDSGMHDAAHRIVDWAIRSNMAHVPTDCPHREKNGWLEQDWHMARSLSYGYDIHGWFTKTCRDIRDAQTADGHIPTNAPNYLVGISPHGYWNNSCEWGVAGVLVPWHLYEWYGDRRVLAESFDSARRFVDCLSSTATDGTVTSNLGDWYDFGHGKGNGPAQWTPHEVSATAIWALGADTVARSAEVLGRPADAATYRALHDRIRRDFQRRFYDPATKTVLHRGSCQAGTSAALCIGLVPEADRAAALDAVVRDLEARDWKQTPGEVLQVFLIRALAEGGRGDVLHRIYNRDDVPSYGHMVASGLTTLPESWDARRGTGDSLNHFMLGHLVEWHYAYVAGIRQQPGGVGWKRILIAPQPAPAADASPHAIRACDATFRSPPGPITVRWKAAHGRFELFCRTPDGVDAVAVLPDGTRHAVAAGGSTFTSPAP